MLEQVARTNPPSWAVIVSSMLSCLSPAALAGREAAAVANAVDNGAELHKLSGLVALPLAGGAQGRGDGAVGGAADADDLGADRAR